MMMENLFERIVDVRKSGTPAALEIIVGAEGPTPRKTGAKMIILKDGETIRTMEEK